MARTIFDYLAQFQPHRLTAFLRQLMLSLNSIRARLIILALVAVVPLMIERLHSLDDSRAARIEQAQREVASMAQQGAQRQAEVIANIEAVMHTLTRLYIAQTRRGMSCEGFLRDVPMASWATTIAIINKSGRIYCASRGTAIGIDVSDRPYFRQALATGQFTLSDYVVARGTLKPVIIAAYPGSLSDGKTDMVMIMAVKLDWLADLTKRVTNSTNASSLLIDSNGTILASHGLEESYAGIDVGSHPLIRLALDNRSGSATLDGIDGVRGIFGYIQIPGTSTHLIVGVDERTTLKSIDSRIHFAYVQLTVFGLIVFLGAWFSGEFLLVRPLTDFARVASKFGEGRLDERVNVEEVAPEFLPLAKAFNKMASRLSGRENELRVANNRLSVLATIDAVSGLANRHGFASRFEFEWLRAASLDQSVGLFMVDIDYFKLYNDTYGHPGGDACLRQIGDCLAAIANESRGYAARYGGEEFVLLLPGRELEDVMKVAESFLAAVTGLGIPHTGSPMGILTVSIGVASSFPGEGDNPHSLVDAADAGLYAAKRRGRNQIVAHGPVDVLDEEPGDAPQDDTATRLHRDEV